MSADHANPASDLDTEARRRRLRFRAGHRGTREMDIVMGRFAESELPRLSEAELAQFEQLMDEQDRDVFDWIIGRAETPPAYRGGLLDRIKAFHNG